MEYAFGTFILDVTIGNKARTRRWRKKGTAIHFTSLNSQQNGKRVALHFLRVVFRRQSLGF